MADISDLISKRLADLNAKLELDRLIEQKALPIILCSRNKLIEDLMCELSLTDKMYRKAIEMRHANWENDRKIFAQVREEVAQGK